MGKDAIIIHHGDVDGVMSAAIVEKTLEQEKIDGDAYIYRKIYNYEKYDTLNDFLKDVYCISDEYIYKFIGRVYIVDCALPPEFVEELLEYNTIEKVVWIDHHVTSIEQYTKYGLLNNEKYKNRFIYSLDTSKSGALLTSEFCKEISNRSYFQKVIGLISIADLYDHENPLFSKAKILYNFLELNLDVDSFKSYISMTQEMYESMLDKGELIEKYKEAQNRKISNRAFILNWEGYTWIACNTIGSIEQVQEAEEDYDHDGVLFFCYIPMVGWKVSMYAGENDTVDFTPIAKKYGGGGHPGACGFNIKELPFSL